MYEIKRGKQKPIIAHARRLQRIFKCWNKYRTSAAQ